MILLYGATGYAGRLAATAAARAGLPIVLAGRRETALSAVAEPLGLDVRVGGLDDVDLTGASAVLNCAGPFAMTATTLLSRCVAAGVAYLDLAGEVTEHRGAAAFDAAARRAGVRVLPGAGFGIVPSDCLAAHVAARVDRVVALQLALKTVGGVSRGTAQVVLGGLRTPGVVRRGGQLVTRRAGAASRRVDFDDGDGPTTVVTNPWRADLVGSVPAAADFEAFMAFPAPVRVLMRVPHGGLLRAIAARLPEGPGEEALTAGRSAIWARATGADGATAEAVLHGPDAYVFTALCAVACLSRVLAGDAPPGYHTPTSTWDADFVAGIDGVTRCDEEAQ